jgi:hypothetical protein
MTTKVVDALDASGSRQLLMVTIRNSGCTATVFLDKANAELWARQILGDAARMSATGLSTG